jgi:hypothetical protein
VEVHPSVPGDGLERQIFSRLINAALATGCTKVWLSPEVASLGQALSRELTT